MEKTEQFKSKAILYIMIALTCSFALAGAAFLDMEMEHNIKVFDLSSKVIIMAGIFAYASICKQPLNIPGSKFFSLWLLVAMIPFAFNAIDYFCIPNRVPGAVECIDMLLSVFSTAAWEEMLFRYVGRSMFERNGKYSLGSIVLLSLTFGCSHLINIFFYDTVSVLLQVLCACTFGVFLLALYQHTGNLWVVITAHGLNNLIATFFDLFPGSESLFQSWINYVLYVLTELAVGIYILIKYGYIERKPKSETACQQKPEN